MREYKETYKAHADAVAPLGAGVYGPISRRAAAEGVTVPVRVARRSVYIHVTHVHPASGQGTPLTARPYNTQHIYITQYSSTRPLGREHPHSATLQYTTHPHHTVLQHQTSRQGTPLTARPYNTQHIDITQYSSTRPPGREHTVLQHLASRQGMPLTA